MLTKDQVIRIAIDKLMDDGVFNEVMNGTCRTVFTPRHREDLDSIFDMNMRNGRRLNATELAEAYKNLKAKQAKKARK